MKPATASASRRRTVFVLSCVLFAAVLTLAAAAWAQSNKSVGWPTTEWVVMESVQPSFLNDARGGLGLDGLPVRPSGERREIAEKHERILTAASSWFQHHSFPAPFQVTEDENMTVDTDEAYLGYLNKDPTEVGSNHKASGLMTLTSHPDFLSAKTPMWKLMEASAVHELYHGIQRSMSPSLFALEETEPPKLPHCPGDSNIDWLTEGTAAMVQIRWLEKQHGVSWGHPFKGSPRASWGRVFDQPLHEGAMPEYRRFSRKRLPGDEPISWACDYGTWYFWYAVGEMIGSTSREKVTYTEFLFSETKPWNDGGIANVDAGLKAAAEAYDAIGPYRGGLHDLYPQFVAQYLTEDRFYEKLEKVDLETPDLFETTSSLSGRPLEPLATRAWRFRIHLPENADGTRYNVRFTLDAEGATDRDDLHLIVDDKVIAQNPDPTVPYATVRQPDRAALSADGVVEYLVRAANVAEEASKTEDAEFSLRVEVNGFYGYETDSPTAGELGAISGELPPGFAMRGPGPWSCNGKGQSRAIFDLVTPDEIGRDIERVFPKAEHDLGSMFAQAEIMIQKMGGESGMTLEQLDALRQQAGKQLADGRAQTGDIDARADEARSARTTELAATFVGIDDAGQMCQMTLGATLAGPHGGGQAMDMAIDQTRYPNGDAPTFDVEVYTAGQLRALQSLQVFPGDPLDGWEICTMTDTARRDARNALSNGCPPVTCSAGELRLERAEQGEIAGMFEFDVIRWPERSGSGCRVPLARDKVVAHFNVSSTDDSFDDNSLGIEAGLKSGMLTQPGAPILDLLP